MFARHADATTQTVLWCVISIASAARRRHTSRSAISRRDPRTGDLGVLRTAQLVGAGGPFLFGWIISRRRSETHQV
jgi:hypothetical protein